MPPYHRRLQPLPEVAPDQRDARPCLALFDFDGTLTRRDSVLEFIRYSVGVMRYAHGMARLAPQLGLYLLGLADNAFAKRAVLNHFFEGIEQARFQEHARRFSSERLPELLRRSALERLRAHRRRGDEVAVVSSSLQDWLEGWCEKERVELIATRASFAHGRYLGDFLPGNCYGPEKARRIQERYRLQDFCQIFAYGDTRGDAEMLALADHAFYRVF